MHNNKLNLTVAPYLEVSVTFQPLPIKDIINWEVQKNKGKKSILLLPTPIAVKVGDGIFELIQPQSTWSADVDTLSFDRLHAFVINGYQNTKAINLIRNIHSNRTHQNRKVIIDQLLHNTTLLEHIEVAYNIQKPVRHIKQLLGCELYCPRQVSRFIDEENKEKSIEKPLSEEILKTSKSDGGRAVNLFQRLPKKETNTSILKVTARDWNRFAGKTKGVWSFFTIVEKTKKDKALVLKLINERLTENDGDLMKVWRIIHNKLGKKHE